MHHEKKEKKNNVLWKNQFRESKATLPLNRRENTPSLQHFFSFPFQQQWSLLENHATPWPQFIKPSNITEQRVVFYSTLKTKNPKSKLRIKSNKSNASTGWFWKQSSRYFPKSQMPISSFIPSALCSALYTVGAQICSVQQVRSQNEPQPQAVTSYKCWTAKFPSTLPQE